MMHGFPYLSVLTLLPLVGAAVVALVPRAQPQLAKVIAFAWSVVVLGFGIAMWVAFEVGGPRFQFRESYTWIPFWGTKFTLQADGIALVMLLVVVVLVPMVIIVSWNEVDERSRSVTTWFAK